MSASMHWVWGCSVVLFTACGSSDPGAGRDPSLSDYDDTVRAVCEEFGEAALTCTRMVRASGASLETLFCHLHPEAPKCQVAPPQDRPAPNPDAGVGAKAKKEEGKVGKKAAKMEKAKGNRVLLQEQVFDREMAENAGLIGDMGQLDGILGSSGLEGDLAGGIGGLLGASGTQMGAGGLGSRGGGLGGGGTASGLGGLGTHGRGSGASGYGEGSGDFGAGSEGAVGRVGGDSIILGALDKSLIDRVIKRHMNQIRYCYQRELNENPSLNGKIVVKFVVSADGSVSNASTGTSTMTGGDAVEACINQRFLEFQFPEPKGGGIVIVSYPFVFSPG